MTEAVTFLLTDVEGSTRLWETRPDAMRSINERHDALVDKVVGETGTVFRDRAEGDSSFAAFDDPALAIAAAVGLQRAIESEPWPDGLTVRVRAALHTGRAESRDGQYYGPVVNRGVRLRALAHGGQVVISGAVASAVETLPDGIELRDLGTHRLKDLAAPEHVYQVCAPELADTFPPLRSLDVVRNNLTAPTTAFVGRTEEVGALVELLSAHRLVTVTGSGGVGKTRLAREVAAALVDQFPDGVWFVDFTAARSEGDVGRATADAVGAKDDPVRTPAEAVAEHLRTTATLLVLDNCEHVAAAAGALVSMVLAAAPDVRVLITSRQPVGVAGERVWRVPPLTGDTATALFLDRAAAVDSARAFDDADRAAVAQLCEQLDGIPLAIEMAAARVAEMPSIAALADALRDRLAVGGTDDAPSRQRTMRATIEWSHELLRPAERRLLRRLAAFLGGFTLEAAEGVCADERLDAFDVLDLLGQLVSQSLVQADEVGAEFRYRLLEVVREFAAERLAEGPEFATVQSRHQAWFMQLAESHAGHLYSAVADALDILESERANLRRAVEWDGESLAEDVRYRLVVSLYRLWVLRGHWEEGVQVSELVLATPVTRRGWRASALVNLAALKEQLGRADEAASVYGQAASLFAEIDADIDTWGAQLGPADREAHHQSFLGQQAWCLVRQAHLSVRAGARDAAERADAAIELAREADERTFALVVGSAGQVDFEQGRYERARERFLTSLPGLAVDQAEVGRTHLRLGAVEWAIGRFAAAVTFYEQARETSEASGDPVGIAHAVRDLADLAVLVRSPGAAALVEEAADRFEAVGDELEIAYLDILRVRLGAAGRAESVVETVRRYARPAVLMEALVAAMESAPVHPVAAAWADEAIALCEQLPGWTKPRARAAAALVRGDWADLEAAASMLALDLHAAGLVDFVRLAAGTAGDARASGLAALERAILEDLLARGVDDAAPALDTWSGEACALLRAD